MEKIKVIIADDHELFVEGLGMILMSDKFQPEVDIVGTAFDGSALLTLLSNVKASLLILDLNMPEIDGLTLIPKIRKNWPQLKILVVSNYDDLNYIRQAFKDGADGYILKSSGIKTFYKGIVEVMNGRVFMSDGIRLSPPRSLEEKKQYLLSMFKDNFDLKRQLTNREMEILILITQANSNKTIASQLFISPETVSVHRKNIMKKLGVKSTAGLIKFAIDHNLT